MKNLSLYVHIPFCERKCFYCAFASFCASQSQIDEYVDLLCKEIVARKEKTPLRTIYFGGGTPSYLTIAQFEKIVNTIFENFDVYEDAEFTLEANPSSITLEKLHAWKNLRVNRLSIGVQTLSNQNLKKIGRLHDKKEAIEKIKLARKVFDNVSADLILGLEGEDGKTVCGYAKTLLELGVKHISCYLLEVYQNTKLFEMIKQKKYKPLLDEEQVEVLSKLSNYLIDAGMTRYEISNFAFPDYESRHNLNYWQRGDYLGVGLGAHSFLNGTRMTNSSTFEGYKNHEFLQEVLTESEIDEEKIMLGLRCNLGVELSSLSFDLTQNPYFSQYLSSGILTQNEGKIYLNPLFYHLSNTIISNLFEK